MKKTSLKKYISYVCLVLVLAAVATFALSACSNDKKENGNEEEPKRESHLLDYENTDLTEYLMLGQYKGLEVKVEEIKISDDDVKAQIKDMLDKNKLYGKITDRDAQKGDTVNINYKGYIDGKEFSGGSATDATVSLTDQSGYIDGFAEGIISHTPNTAFSVYVTFPENYGYADYAGKDAEFVITLNYIIDYTVSDTAADKLSDGECKSGELFHEYLKEKLYREKNESNMYSAFWSQIVAASTVIKYPECSVNYYYDQLKLRCQTVAAQMGITYEKYLAYVKMTEADLEEYAKNYTRNDLIIHSIAKAERLAPSDEEFSEYAIEYTNMYFASIKQEMISNGHDSNITIDAAVAYIKENYAYEVRYELTYNSLVEFVIANNSAK